MAPKFGTSGLRGLVAELTDPLCAAYATAFLHHLRADGIRFDAVLLGGDLRPSTRRIAAACAAAVEAAGATPIDCGVLPTPALALEATRRRLPALMVSGSHIPFDRNGLKFYRPDGEITKDDEAGILAALVPGAPAPAPVAHVAHDEGAAFAYLDRYASFFGSGRLSGRTVGVWQHSAAGRDLLVEALERLGANPIPVGRTDGFVPIDTEAIAAADAARIAGWVAEHRLDALVSTDGDGDRPLVADERGAVLRGDVVGLLTARALGADAVATPLNATTAIERSGFFSRIVRTRIGSPYVIAGLERLAAEGATLPVGFECNGGFLLAGTVHGPEDRTLAPLPTRDAMTPILALLAAAADAGAPLSSLAAALPPRATMSDRLQEIPDTRSGPFLATLADDAEARAELLDGLGSVSAVDTLDGVRMTLDGGDIVHFRASGNAPELRCYTECATPAEAERLLRAALARAAVRLAA